VLHWSSTTPGRSRGPRRRPYPARASRAGAVGHLTARGGRTGGATAGPTCRGVTRLPRVLAPVALAPRAGSTLSATPGSSGSSGSSGGGAASPAVAGAGAAAA